MHWMCSGTPVHYDKTGRELVAGPLHQEIIDGWLWRRVLGLADLKMGGASRKLNHVYRFLNSVSLHDVSRVRPGNMP
jgi:hypothetical protein